MACNVDVIMQALGSVHQREATLRQFSELGNAFALLTMMDQVRDAHAHSSVMLHIEYIRQGMWNMAL